MSNYTGTLVTYEDDASAQELLDMLCGKRAIRTENAVRADNGIERVIFNDPATVVFWEDGTKTVVKCQEGDSYNEQTGLLMCIAKRYFGNTGRFNDVLHEWVPCEEVEPAFDWEAVQGWQVRRFSYERESYK